jgi:two-component system cell cycle response regulator
MLDVDCFKCYNDHYGHPQGDWCLVQVAGAIQQVVKRPPDLVARYGGEEFAVILPETDRPGAMAVAQAIQTTIRQLVIPHSASPVQTPSGKIVTVSIGITSLLPDDNTTTALMLQQADKALYRAKTQGRNRYEVFAGAIVP